MCCIAYTNQVKHCIYLLHSIQTVFASTGKTLKRLTGNERYFARDIHWKGLSLIGAITNAIDSDDDNKLREQMKKIVVIINENKKDYEIFSNYLFLFIALENLIIIGHVRIFRCLVIHEIDNRNKMDNKYDIINI